MSVASPPQRPRRILMSVDAVGGVWRYAMDLGGSLAARGVEVVFACFGPPPSAQHRAEAEKIGTLVTLDAPLDWTASGEDELLGVAGLIEEQVARHGIDLVHLNLPSQAAALDLPIPIVVASHSCVVTWFRAVRGTPVPPDWAWQETWNRAGFGAADAIIVPSRSFGELLTECYGPLPHLAVVYNASQPKPETAAPKEPFILAAGRWWDEGKNGRVLDSAAQGTRWPVRMAGSVDGPNGQHQSIEHAEHLGDIAHDELRSVMRRASIFASPSIFEPFGLAPLEAALVGCALVLSDIPTYRELWDGAAVFAPPEDATAFRAALNGLAADPERRGALGRAARQHARRYSLAGQADAMLQIYAGVMQRKTTRLRRAS